MSLVQSIVPFLEHSLDELILDLEIDQMPAQQNIINLQKSED
jgi:hypothetical protein